MTALNTATSLSDIESLVKGRAVGYSLDAPFYTSREIFDLDVAAIFAKHWLFCATEAEIPEPGDFVTVDIGPFSVIVVRDDDNLRAWHNVCRHRGSKILDAPCGAVGNLVCPYHQWTYRTDGSLIFAESQPPTFDQGRFGLKPVNVRSVSGLVFLCLSDEPPADLDEVAGVLEPYLTRYGLRSTKVGFQQDLVVEGNWKLVLENNRECQHCDASNPELVSAYFPLFGYSEDDVPPRLRPVFERYQAAATELWTVCAATRFPRDERRELDTRVTGFQVSHLPLDGAGASFGPGGESVCKQLMGSIAEPRFGDLSVHMQPNSWFHFLSDHAVVFRALPLGPDRTLVRTTWLVHSDAVEGLDYDVESLTTVWRATNNEDRSLIAKAQDGITSPGYEPGPYSLVEDDVEAFVNWYIGRLHEHISA
ncbi:aromatic ring-hydroxylating dioxygenase subunit alpha [Kribbella sp. NPDC050124]|uniref:aromatic ring-hydroxylating dioxygenase subunit alpha n=1 Tax=Kribbella sp. NPDC050124 TaxID=3364114 RepID=UPI0037B2FF85